MDTKDIHMDKIKRQSRFIQKSRNKSKWFRREMEKEGKFGANITEHAVRTARLETNHGKLCSCYMCGNPRRHFKEVTLQEKKADEYSKDLDSYEE